MHSSPFAVVRLVSALALLAGLSACSTAVKLDPAGTNVGVYTRGEFSALVQADGPATLRAARQAFRDMGMLELQKPKPAVGRFDAKLVVRTSKDEKAPIHIHEVNSLQTQLDIRLDKKTARELYERIDRILGGS